MTRRERDHRVAAGARLAGASVLLWCAIVGVWMLLVDTYSVAEVLAGAATALLATVATLLVYAQRVVRLRPSAKLAWMLPRWAAQVPIDLWLLARELIRALAGGHRGGRFYARPFAGGVGPRENARRAAIELFGSLAPNTIVVGVDERQVIVHQLAARHVEREGL
jgi:multisubunit Na+/H+ antiporter MnhE subunit